MPYSVTTTGTEKTKEKRLGANERKFASAAYTGCPIYLDYLNLS